MKEYQAAAIFDQLRSPIMQWSMHHMNQIKASKEAGKFIPCPKVEDFEDFIGCMVGEIAERLNGKP